MSAWVCPRDRAVLSASADGLRCSNCGGEWPVDRGVAVFAGSERTQGLDPVERNDLEVLGAAVARVGTEAAAREICAAWGCTRGPLEASWRYLLRFPEGGRIVEIGSGFGDDLVEFAPRADALYSIAPTLAHARLLAARLDSVKSASVALCPDLTRIPLPDRSIDAIAIDDDAAASFGLDAGKLEQAADEWRRILRPEGTLVVGLAHRMGRLVARWTISGGGAHKRCLTLRQRIKRQGDTGVRLPSFRRVSRLIEARGFARPIIYAPLPDEHRALIVAPIEERAVVGWCLAHQVRRRSASQSALFNAVRLLARAGAAVHCVPYHFLYFRRVDAPAVRD